MGKKSKKKRKNYKYTKTEFVDIICTKCGLCPEGTDPVFCYNDVYVNNHKKFIKVIFKNLIEVKRWLVNIGHSDPTFCPDEDIEYIFKMSFCQSDYCKQRPLANHNCAYLAGCIGAFRGQIKNPNNQIMLLNEYRNRKKKEKKNKNSYKQQPCPTFFCKPGMEDEVKKIINGNNIK